jgi:F-type H+-transporting ATPase subunit epsilon
MKFHLRISTQHGLFFDGEVLSLNVKTASGYETIYGGHTYTIVPIDISRLKVESMENHIIYAAINRGLMYISPKEVLIVTNSIEAKEEIDVERQNKTIQENELLLENKNISLEEKERAHLEIKKAKNRLSVLLGEE